MIMVNLLSKKSRAEQLQLRTRFSDTGCLTCRGDHGNTMMVGQSMRAKNKSKIERGHSMRKSRGRRHLIPLLLLAIVGLTCPAAHAQKVSEDVVLCDLGVSKGLAQANASFSIVYEVGTNTTGRVERVTKVENRFIPEEAVTACLSRWTLSPPSATFKVSLDWEHGKGWTRMNIIGPADLIRRIRFEAGRWYSR